MRTAVHAPPPSDGGGGSKARRGKAAGEMSADSRSEIFEIDFVAFPLRPLRGHLPRKTGEAIYERGRRTVSP